MSVLTYLLTILFTYNENLSAIGATKYPIGRIGPLRQGKLRIGLTRTFHRLLGLGLGLRIGSDALVVGLGDGGQGRGHVITYPQRPPNSGKNILGGQLS